jgi:hypothetical protein
LSADEQDAIEGTVVDGDTIDIDLDDEDSELREEAVRSPIVVRVSRQVITIPHVTDWPLEAAAKANAGDWNGWAEMVLSDSDLAKFKNAELRMYQIERILKVVNKRSGITPGKSSRSSGSRKGTARR